MKSDTHIVLQHIMRAARCLERRCACLRPPSLAHQARIPMAGDVKYSGTVAIAPMCRMQESRVFKPR